MLIYWCLLRSVIWRKQINLAVVKAAALILIYTYGDYEGSMRSTV